MLVVITGLSAGVGKETVLKHLINKGFERVVTVSARKPRAGEKQGDYHNFVNKSTFEQWIKEEKFLEYVVVTGDYKGTLKGSIDKPLSEGKDIAIIVDIGGAMTIKSHFPKAVTIFLTISNFNVLEKRMKKRGDAPKMIKKRLSLAKKEIGLKDKADFVILNEEGKLNETLLQVDTIIGRLKGK